MKWKTHSRELQAFGLFFLGFGLGTFFSSLRDLSLGNKNEFFTPLLIGLSLLSVGTLLLVVGFRTKDKQFDSTSSSPEPSEKVS
jgi:hypothetical protein